MSTDLLAKTSSSPHHNRSFHTNTVWPSLVWPFLGSYPSALGFTCCCFFVQNFYLLIFHGNGVWYWGEHSGWKCTENASILLLYMVILWNISPRDKCFQWRDYCPERSEGVFIARAIYQENKLALTECCSVLITKLSQFLWSSHAQLVKQISSLHLLFINKVLNITKHILNATSLKLKRVLGWAINWNCNILLLLSLQPIFNFAHTLLKQQTTTRTTQMGVFNCCVFAWQQINELVIEKP